MKLSRLAKILLLTAFMSTNTLKDARAPDKEYVIPHFPIQRKTIVIDPGHGGKDAGYKNKTTKEKEINLNIAKHLKELLEKQGYKVHMTREKDNEINTLKLDYNYDGEVNQRDELLSRKHTIKNLDADYFLSLHNNADSRTKRTNGLEIWTYGYRHNHEKTNNRIDHHPPHRCRTKNEEAYKTAQSLEKIFKDAGFKTKIACGDFTVLEKNPVKKSMIIEYGYLTNPDDLRRMQSKDFQEYCAKITAKYFEKNETPYKN